MNLNKLAENWEALTELETIHLLRDFSKQHRFHELPVKEMFDSGNKRLRKEIIKHLDYSSIKSWRDAGFSALISSEEAEYKKAYSKLMKPDDHNFDSGIYTEALAAVMESDTVTDELISMFVKDSKTPSLVVSMLSAKRASYEICRALLQSSAASVEALSYQLDALPEFHFSYLNASLEVKNIVIYDDSLSYRNFFKIHTLAFPDSKVERRSGLTDYNLFSKNYFKAFRTGVLGYKEDRSSSIRVSSRDRRGLSALSIYEQMFTCDEDWEELLKFGFLSNQKDLVCRFLKCLYEETMRNASTQASNNATSSYTHPATEMNLSLKAKEALVEYALRDESCNEWLMRVIYIEPAMFSDGTVKALIHSAGRDKLFLKFSSPERTFNSSISIAERCCSENLKACPAWTALYRWRFTLPQFMLTKFEKLEEEIDDGEFYPLAVAPAYLHTVPEGDIEKMISYSERVGVENLPECERTSYSLFKSFF